MPNLIDGIHTGWKKEMAAPFAAVQCSPHDDILPVRLVFSQLVILSLPSPAHKVNAFFLFVELIITIKVYYLYIATN